MYINLDNMATQVEGLPLTKSCVVLMWCGHVMPREKNKKRFTYTPTRPLNFKLDLVVNQVKEFPLTKSIAPKR